jgi:hypothetical protein
MALLQPRRIPIIVANAALRPFAPIWRASVPVLVEVGAAAFFISGLAPTAIGSAAPWLVLGVVLLGAWMRRAEAEAWALFIPGGAAARVRMAFGSRAGTVAGAAGLIERVLFVGLLTVALGHYAVSIVVSALAEARVASLMAADDLSVAAALVFLGTLWIRARQGKAVSDRQIAPWVWWSLGVAVLMTAMGAAVLLLRHQPGPLLAPVPADLARDLPDWGRGLANAIRLPLAARVGVGLALPALGTAEQISRACGRTSGRCSCRRVSRSSPWPVRPPYSSGSSRLRPARWGPKSRSLPSSASSACRRCPANWRRS